MDEDKDAPEVLETPAETETTPPEASETETETLSPEEIKNLREAAAQKEELEKKNRQLFERVKKAEAKAPSKELGLSAKDFLALKDANISADDFDEVQEFATFKKIPISEALSNPTLKTILNDRQEQRRTALATQTSGGARGTTKTSGEDLLARAEKTGEMPDTAEGMKALAEARLARRKAEKS